MMEGVCVIRLLFQHSSFLWVLSSALLGVDWVPHSETRWAPQNPLWNWCFTHLCFSSIILCPYSSHYSPLPASFCRHLFPLSQPEQTWPPLLSFLLCRCWQQELLPAGCLLLLALRWNGCTYASTWVYGYVGKHGLVGTHTHTDKHTHTHRSIRHAYSCASLQNHNMFLSAVLNDNYRSKILIITGPPDRKWASTT